MKSVISLPPSNRNRSDVDNRRNATRNGEHGLAKLSIHIIFLNDDYQGGRAQFLVSKTDARQPAKSSEDVELVSVITPKGAVLCFPHGSHPQHCLHGGESISKGTKYIIRTDILFSNQEQTQ